MGVANNAPKKTVTLHSASQIYIRLLVTRPSEAAIPADL